MKVCPIVSAMSDDGFLPCLQGGCNLYNPDLKTCGIKVAAGDDGRVKVSIEVRDHLTEDER